MSFSNLPEDVISDLYQYMTPIELYQRHKIDPIWNQAYQEALPEWSKDIEPWIITSQTGDLELLNDLYRHGPLEFEYVDGEMYVDDIEYSKYYDGLIKLALDNGHGDVARIFIDRYPPDEDGYPGIFYEPRTLLLDDKYALKYIQEEQPLSIIDEFSRNIVIVRHILEKMYRKGYISDEWLINLYRTLLDNLNIDYIGVLESFYWLLDHLNVKVPEDLAQRSNDISQRLQQTIRDWKQTK